MKWHIALNLVFCTLSGTTLAAEQSKARDSIETRYTALFQDELFIGWTADWLFDAAISAALIADFDEDNNGIFDAKEQVAINKASLPTLHERGFFTSSFAGQDEVPLIAITGISSRIDDGQVRFHFTIGVLGNAVDIRRSGLVTYLYDSSALTTLIPAKDDAVIFGEDAPPECVARVQQNADIVQRQGKGSRTLLGAVHSVETILAVQINCEDAEAAKEGE